MLVNVRELEEEVRRGEGWLRVALNAPLHIKRLVAWRDLFVQNTAPRACVEHHDSLVLLRLSAHVRLLSFEKFGPPDLKKKKDLKSNARISAFIPWNK